MWVCASINPGRTVALDRSTTNARDLVALNHDDLVGKRLAGLHVQQVSGANDNHLRGKRALLRPAHADASERNNKHVQIRSELHSIPPRELSLSRVRYNFE
jgi:hypothetical protein